MSSLPVSMKKIGEKVVATSIFRRPRAGNSVVRGQILSNFELIQALMYVIVTCKYEKDPIKTAKKKGQHRFTIINYEDFFSDAILQLTPQSVVKSRRIANSSELSCMPWLTAGMKKFG